MIVKEVKFLERHECPDWDFLEIGPEDAEWECCTCKYYPKIDESKLNGDNKGQE